MKSNMKVRVTFRHADDNLCNMFCRTYNTVERAKTAIEIDAEHFLHVHNKISKHDAYVGRKPRASGKWMDVKNTDYYRAIAKDGTTCYWQYFVEQ